MTTNNNSEELWGSINPEDWNKISFIKDEIATEEDVKSGRAVFYIANKERILFINL